MASDSKASNVAPDDQHEHLRPEGKEPLARITVDYTPDACLHAPASGEIHVMYDHRGGARWKSRNRLLPGGAVAATVRAPAGDTAGLNYNLYLSFMEGSDGMDEIDFQIGNDRRAVQTNFFVAGRGDREMVHELPFDSSYGFHHYAVAWGAEAIEWRVDGEVLRREERRDGEPWPEKPMFLYASLWDARSYRDVRLPVALSAEEEECQDDADAGDEDDAAATTCGAAEEEVDAGAGAD